MSRNIVSDFQQEPKQVLSEILENKDAILRESEILEIIEAYPQKSQELCQYIKSDAGKGKCRRFQERPHLWTVNLEQKPYWTSGMFDERVLFPELPLQQIPSYEKSQCKDRICVENSMKKFAKEGNIGGIWSACNVLSVNSKDKNDRGYSDCLFRGAESLDVQYYKDAVWMCQNAVPYQPECHNHVLLKIVSQNDIYMERHQKSLEIILDVWKEHPKYQKEIENVYWSLVGSRMLGTFKPIERKWIAPYQNHLYPYLNNALALRLVTASDPIAEYEKLMEGTTINPPKAPSPDHPNFISKRFQSNKGVYLCDFRCGKRMVRKNQREDFILALYYVAHTYKNGQSLQQRLREEYTFLPEHL